jgi:hypothetical protein
VDVGCGQLNSYDQMKLKWEDHIAHLIVMSNVCLVRKSEGK